MTPNLIRLQGSDTFEELLAAAKSGLAALLAYTNDSPAIRQLRAAIAKAEGTNQ